MKRGFKTAAAALGAVLLLGVFAAGAAFAQTPPPEGTNYHDVFVGKVAKILGIDQQKLTGAFTQARSETLDEAVKEGRITQDQAKFMRERMEQAGVAGGPMGFGGGPMHGGRFGGRFGGTSGTTPWGTPPWSATPAPSQ